MEFVRLDRQPRHGAARGQRARRRRHGHRAERSARHRGVSRRMSLLTVKALNQSYGGSHTLWDVDLAVPQGSRTCLMGRNGMGKTTLLKCIMGLLPATSGEIDVCGHGHPRAAGGEPRAPRHRLRAAGARDLLAPDGRGEPARRPRRAQGRRARDDSAADLRAVPGAEEDAAAPRAATCPAASSSSWRSAGRSCSSRSCSSSTSRPKASSRTSCTRSATSSSRSIATPA